MFRSMLARSSSSAKQALLHRGPDLERKVAIFGATDGIGQPLGLLTKLNPLASKLSLCDITNTPGVKKLCGVATLDVVGAKTFYAGKAKVPLAAFNTGLCVARSVAASLACGRHPESTDATGEASIMSSDTPVNSESAEVTRMAVASLHGVMETPLSEELEFVIKVTWPSTDQDFSKTSKILHEIGEKISEAVKETFSEAQE